MSKCHIVGNPVSRLISVVHVQVSLVTTVDHISVVHKVWNSCKNLIEPQHEISNNLTSEDWNKPLQPLFKLRNSKWCTVSSFTPKKNHQATSKGTDQTVRMRRLVLAFAGHTYHIVGNLMSRLNSFTITDNAAITDSKSHLVQTSM